MSSTVLVQEQRQEVLHDARGAVGAVSVESKITGIFLTAGDGARKGDGAEGFDFSVDLDEQGRSDGVLNIRFSMVFGKKAGSQKCQLDGEAAVRFSNFNPDRDFSRLGEDVTNEMVVEIFRKNYESIYLIHQSLGVEAPSPWVMRGVSLSSRSMPQPAPGAASL